MASVSPNPEVTTVFRKPSVKFAYEESSFAPEESSLDVEASATTSMITSTTKSGITIDEVPPGVKVLGWEEYFFIKASINFAEFYENVLNTYELFDAEGKRMFIALEIGPAYDENKRCDLRPYTWNTCSYFRGYNFRIPIVNSDGVEIIRLKGRTSPKFRLFSFKRGKVQVENDQEVFGQVIEEPEEGNNVRCYSVQKSNGRIIYIIKSTPDVGTVGSDISEAEFLIFVPNTTKAIGKISTTWDKLLHKIFPSTTQNFGIHLPDTCSPRMKAVLIGAMFLINYQFYERKQFVVGKNTWEIMDE